MPSMFICSSSTKSPTVTPTDNIELPLTQKSLITPKKHKRSITLPHILRRTPSTQVTTTTAVQPCTAADTAVDLHGKTMSPGDIAEWMSICDRVVNRASLTNPLPLTERKLSHTTIKPSRRHSLPLAYTALKHRYTKSAQSEVYVPSALHQHAVKRHSVSSGSARKIHRSLRKIRRNNRTVQFTPVTYYRSAMLQLDVYKQHTSVTLRETNQSVVELFDGILTLTPMNGDMTHDDILQLHATPKNIVVVPMVSEKTVVYPVPVRRGSVGDAIKKFEALQASALVDTSFVTPSKTRSRNNSHTASDSDRMSSSSSNSGRSRSSSVRLPEPSNAGDMMIALSAEQRDLLKQVMRAGGEAVKRERVPVRRRLSFQEKHMLMGGQEVVQIEV